MLSSLKYLIAGRYVRSPKSHSVINIISAVSIVAMAIPVAAIILLLSIFNGLERMALDNLKSVDSDLSITPREGTTFRVEELPSALLDDLADVEQYSFILEQSALAQMGASRAVVQVRGVDEGYTSVVPVAKNILVCEFTTRAEEKD